MFKPGDVLVHRQAQTVIVTFLRYEWNGVHTRDCVVKDPDGDWRVVSSSYRLATPDEMLQHLMETE